MAASVAQPVGGKGSLNALTPDTGRAVYDMALCLLNAKMCNIFCSGAVTQHKMCHAVLLQQSSGKTAAMVRKSVSLVSPKAR